MLQDQENKKSTLTIPEKGSKQKKRKQQQQKRQEIDLLGGKKGK